MVKSFMGLEDVLRIGLVTSFSVVAIEAVVLEGGGVDLEENIVPCLVKPQRFYNLWMLHVMQRIAVLKQKSI
jgi:hypothetical protein